MRIHLLRHLAMGFLCASVPLWFVPSARADVAVAPLPREVRSDGSRDPIPSAENAPKENPLEVVERIVVNSKAVGEKLAMTDTGKETQGKQDSILKDIDALIDQQDNPPPQGGGDSSDKDKNQDKDKGKGKDKSEDMDPKGGNDPKGGKDPMGGEPKDGNQQAGRKPRQGEKGGAPPKQSGKDPGGAKQDPGMAKADPMMGMNPGSPTGGVPMGKGAAKPSLPIDDAVVKEVWGHLPDKLRQQVSQYYKEQFMPKYSDLLKQYYSSLANAPMKP